MNPLLRALYFQKSRTGLGKVTLVIPWVVKEKERLEVYPDHVFSNGKVGRKQQEDLIRNWIVEKAGMKEESKKLRIQFYPATYQKKLGSILTLVDICSLIPEEEADVAILEEPEHLNWFSMPSYYHSQQGRERQDDFIPSSDIGWTAKFQHVVGIIHTNYPAYARAGVIRGSRTIASRTIHALSQLVCRSYCHKIIKLSKTLPVFAEYKECVCNVHGVRSDFILQYDDDDGEDVTNLVRDDGGDAAGIDKDEDVAIYFIGKILWAKGFQYILECEERFRDHTGNYFPIDIYGGGPDMEQVKRAFFGVRAMNEVESKDVVPHEEEVGSIPDNSDDGGSASHDDGQDDNDNNNEEEEEERLQTLKRETKNQGEGHEKNHQEECHVESSISTTQEKESMVVDAINEDEGHDKKVESAYFHLSQIMLKSMPFLEDEMKKDDDKNDSSSDKQSTFQTLKDGLHLVKSFQKETLLKKVPKNKYEWRKTPVPVRFLGPKDHAALKFSSYKIFVNPSITEVLCTTSAEALAMGKFVIMPVHPSNEFFYQFPNCLTYESIDDFVEQIKFALQNEPMPLSKELRHVFTWDAAMERLVEAAAITEAEWEVLERSGRSQRDKRKAWIHKESRKMLKGDVLKSILGDLPKEDLKEYEIDSNIEGTEKQILNFDNNSPIILAFLSLLIAIISYFAQR